MQHELAVLFATEMLSQVHTGGDVLELMTHLSGDFAEETLRHIKSVDRYVVAAAQMSTAGTRTLIDWAPAAQIVQYNPRRFVSTFIPILQSGAYSFRSLVLSCAFLYTLDEESTVALFSALLSQLDHAPQPMRHECNRRRGKYA